MNKSVWDRLWIKGTSPDLHPELIKIIKRIAPGKKILEIGYGTGGDLAFLKKEDFDCFGLEASGVAHKRALKKKLFKSILGDGENPPFSEKEFDLIFHQGLLEHFKDPRRFLAEHWRMLKPKGIVVIDVPHKWNLFTIYKGVIGLFGGWYGGWERSYSAAELKDLAGKTGFKPVAVYYRGIWPHRWGKFLFPERIIKRKWVNLIISKPPVVWLQRFLLRLYRKSEFLRLVSSHNVILVAKKRSLRVALDLQPLKSRGGGIRRYVQEIKDLLPKGDFVFVRQEPDIYHATANWGVPLFCPCPVVTTIHDIIPLTFPGYFKQSKLPLVSEFLYRLKIQISLILSQKIICTDSLNAKAITRSFLVDRRKLAIVPMAVSRNFFGKRKIRVKQPYILNHGGIDRRKNLGRLIEAFSLTKNLDLIITGDNPKMVSELKILSKKLKVSDRIKFVGWVNEKKISILVRNAACVVYLTLAEGFGLPLLEAMAAGVPAVTSKIPILKKLGKDVPVFINPKNVESIAAGIEKAVRGVSKRRLAKGQQIAEKYTWPVTSRKTYQVYLDAISGL